MKKKFYTDLLESKNWKNPEKDLKWSSNTYGGGLCLFEFWEYFLNFLLIFKLSKINF